MCPARTTAPFLLFLACGSASPAIGVEEAREIGVVRQSALIVGRDGGWGARLLGHEVFVFGDTVVTKADAGGSTFHSNSFSFSDDTTAAGGLTLRDPLDPVGSPLPLIAPTDDEAAFIAAHRGDNGGCAQKPCGARWATWAGASVDDDKRGRALISYGLIYAEPGEWNFHGVGQALAVWTDVKRQAARPLENRCPGHPTLLFCEGEGGWADALVADGDHLYGFRCDNRGLSSQCKLARVPLANALDHDRWQAWDGKQFGPLDAATTLFEGGLNMRVHYNRHAGAWLAIYSKPLSNDVAYRSAPALTGPWTDAATLFVAQRASGSTYDAYVQPDFSEDGGRVLYVTFSRPTGGWFGSELALVRVTLSRVRPF